MRLKHLVLSILALGFTCVSGAVWADGIPVYNNSFEISNPAQYTCPAPETCSWNGGPIPGWISSQGWNSAGSYQPGNVGTFTSLPDGTTVAWVSSGTISQTLDASLVPDSTYILSVYVGHRLPDATPLYPGDPAADLIANYSISLEAGNTTLATLTGSNGDIAAGTFALETLTYTTGDVVAPGDLTIVLGGSGQQIDFDDVQMDPEPTPEPSSFVLMGIGAACLTLLWRHSQA
jgi:hypothetical protein